MNWIANPRRVSAMKPYVLVIGHAAAAGEAPANTLAGVSACLDCGAEAMEIDVQLSKDGVPLLFHDATLNERVVQKNGLLGPVENYTFDQLSTLVRLTNGERIPTLRQALETIVYPASRDLQANHARSQAGTLEIIPMQSALTLFIWSKHRILPVTLTEFSITEEAFDPALNPIRAKVTLGMRVLSVNDVGFDQKAGSLFMIYQQQKERLARVARAGSFGNLGITGIP